MTYLQLLKNESNTVATIEFEDDKYRKLTAEVDNLAGENKQSCI